MLLIVLVTFTFVAATNAVALSDDTGNASANYAEPTAGGLKNSSSSTNVPKALGTWPSKVFAPYTDVLLWPTFDVANAAKTTGSKYYTLAFIVSDASGNPSWGSSVPLSQAFYNDIITNLRSSGGDVIISFGGAIGNPHSLRNKLIHPMTNF